MMRALLILLLAPTGCLLGEGADYDIAAAAEGVWGANSTSMRRAAGVTGGVWIAEGTGVAANLSLPDEALAARATRTSDHCKILEGVTAWSSKPGLTPLRISSSLQDAVATYYQDRYQFSGLVGGPIFAADDELVVAHEKTGLEIRVPAPPPIVDVGAHLGEPAGLATVFSAPDGEFDLVTVYVSATGPTPGEAGISCAYPAADMTAAGGWRSVPLVDADTIAEAELRGLQLGSVFAGYFRMVVDEAIFGEPAPIKAGQMVSVSAADLS
jgi:hypothetical protein